MADRIKGITVQIGGDTTGLSKALSGVNKEISSTQSQLKDVERLLKLDPTNTKLLEQKQRLLAEAVGETKTKLESLKDAEVQVQQQVKEGKASQEQYEALQREIVATEASLNSLEAAASKSNAALAKVGAEAQQLADKTGKLSSQTKLFSAAAGGALTAAAGLAVSAGLAADDLNTLAKQSGFSTEQLQIWQYGADRVDVSMETIVAAATKLKKNMVSTSSDVSAAWERLGVSVVDSNGALRDSTDVFDETVAALSQIENETERDTLAMTLFGKSADELAGLVDDGGQAFREYGEEAQAAGLILSQDALDSANEFNDAVDKLKAQTAGTFAGLGTEIATMLIPFMEDLGATTEDVLAWIRGLDEGQLKLIGTILLVVAAISPLLSGISKTASMVNTVTTVVIPGLSSAFGFLTGTVLPGVSTGFSTMAQFVLANPVVLLIAGIVALVAFIAAKGDEIQALLQRVDNFLQGIFARDWTQTFGPVLGGALNLFFSTLKGIWDRVYQLLNGVIDFVRGVFTGDWQRAWQGVTDIFGSIFSGLTGLISGPIDAVVSIINGAIGVVDSLLSKLSAASSASVSVPRVKKYSNLPMMASGGVLSQGSAIVGEAGPELLTMAGGRAVVQPLTNSTTHTATFGATNIYIYGAPGQSEQEIAEMVMERIQAETDKRGAVFA